MSNAEVDSETINVRVLFFGAARDAVGHNEVAISLRKHLPVSQAFTELLDRYPDLRRFGRSLLFAVNQEYAPGNQEILDGDELALFPPVSGGDNPNAEAPTIHDFFELTTRPLDVGAIARRVVLPECGATVTLDGYAREWTAGRKTLYLVYEAYESMARREMLRLGNEAHQRFEIAHLGIVHRLGKLEIGETSVVISVSAAHRRAAFAACEWVIQELKRTVPIWKKEVFGDGEVWVESESPGPQLQSESISN